MRPESLYRDRLVIPLLPDWLREKLRSVGQASSTPLLLALICLLAFSAALPAGAVTHSTQSKKTHQAAIHAHRRVHFVKWNPTFPGSHDLLVQQNVELDRLQMPRIADEQELMRYEISQDLVPLSESQALKIADSLADNRRYCRPWTRDFLQDFSDAFYSEFHTPLQVNSLVRTAEQQRKLRRHNHYAAPDSGDTASTHLTGVAVDLSRRGLTRDQYDWIRNYLMPLKAGGKVDPIEERQPVLHLVVYESYSDRLMDTGRGWSEASEPTDGSVGFFSNPTP